MRGRFVLASLVVIAAGSAWWRFTRPRTITVCVFTDAAFRQRADWSGVLKARLEAVNRIYERQAGIRWQAVDMSRTDPTDGLSVLDRRRAALAQSTDCQADLLLAITGSPEGNRTASVSPFSHTAMIVDDAGQPESRNVLVLAHELAHLFGAVHDPGSNTLMADRPINERFSPQSLKLIERMRGYDFAHGTKALEGAVDGQAFAALRESLQGRSPNPEFQAHRILAAALDADGLYDREVPHLQAALRIEPKNVSTRFDLAVALERDSQDDVATATLREGVAVTPESARLHSALGAAVLKRNREEAIDEFMASLRIEPNNAPLFATLGDVLANGMGRTDAAIAAYQDALKLSPGLVQAQKGLAQALAARSQAAQDVISLRREAARNPGQAGAVYGLGIAEARAGNSDAAIKALRQAIQLQPKFGEAHASLALMYYLRGDYAGSWTEVDAARAVGTNPESALVEALMRKKPR